MFVAGPFHAPDAFGILSGAFHLPTSAYRRVGQAAAQRKAPADIPLVNIPLRLRSCRAVRTAHVVGQIASQMHQIAHLHAQPTR
jgi:hypothetical protein